MAEKLVSPGVFTQEKDLSFLPVGIGQIGAALIGPALKGPAFRPVVVTSYQDFIDIFGDLDSSTYLPYTAKSYLRSAGAATIIRIMGSEPWTEAGSLNVTANGTVIATLVPTIGNTGITAPAYTGGTTVTIGTISGISFDPVNANYIANLFSTSPKASGSGVTGQFYLYRFFPVAASASAAAGATFAFETPGVSGDGTLFVTNAQFSNAKTPWITSQTSAGTALDMFRFGRVSDGTEGNYDIKVAIEDIRKSGTVPGTAYPSFNIFVRRVGGFLGSSDSDKRQEVIESFLNVTTDPLSQNYILKRIGDMYSTVDSNGRVTMFGDFPNKSKYIYVDPVVGFDSLPPSLYPFGFRVPKSTIPFKDNGAVLTPLLTYVTRQGTATTYDNRVDFGFDFYNADCKQLLYSLPDTGADVPANMNTTWGNDDFNLDYMFSHNSASGVFGVNGSTFLTGSSLSSSNAPVEMLKFAIPFQGGHEGMPYNKAKNIGGDITANNVFGFDCSTAISSGSLSYIKALNILSNADEYDINLIVTPGIISSIHPSVTDKAISVCENRGDAFYIMDVAQLTDGVSQVVANVSGFDTNYAGTYYPWVKVEDNVSKKLLWVPPAVVVPGVYANNDKVGYEWFAPAGLNRGGVSEAKQAYFRLTQADRDQLYLNRINPIASFPNIGVCVWGQKTLQAKASALDRINVRRLLIATKKYIASATKYLVFEQNTTATRNRFLNIVNPYLDSVKQRQGLYAFKVVMDDKNNTPDLIDRNIMYGQIFLQPTRTAEFLLIDFNILPTGATFSA